eukprot:TRINITY_DN1581_c0_g1_i1.p2 TRINITY_DN1581_c0_g1~~TRINITY_DN1581_c0_g1_i1.p2  ORF type:complete len:296 (-),score=62.16 TRINITY_DN1581_c0_g1_i1:2959-3846(-)
MSDITDFQAYLSQQQPLRLNNLSVSRDINNHLTLQNTQTARLQLATGNDVLRLDPTQWSSLGLINENVSKNFHGFYVRRVTNTGIKQLDVLINDVGTLMLTHPGDYHFKTGLFDATPRMVITADNSVGVGLTTPLEKLHVAGQVRSNAGTLSPIFFVSPGPVNVNQGAFYTLSEPGNPSVNGGLYVGGFVSDQSGESTAWTQARLIFRIVGMDGDANVGGTNIGLEIWEDDATGINRKLGSGFTVSSPNQFRGYVTAMSPWFTPDSFDILVLKLKVASTTNNVPVRFGNMHIQFK